MVAKHRPAVALDEEAFQSWTRHWAKIVITYGVDITFSYV